MQEHVIHIFISHSWSYSEHYEKLYEWIFHNNWNIGGTPIIFKDFSVPKDDPIHNANNGEELREAIYRKISRSHVVIIPTGMYASYSKWIRKEIEGSKLYRKPILAVNPWSQERKSSVVIKNSDSQCGWNKKSVVNSIWSLYRKNY